MAQYRVRHSSDNVRSLRVAERCGLRRDQQVHLMEGVLDQYVWPGSDVPDNVLYGPGLAFLTLASERGR
jgi:RimJ/RimL family protein N-acetyltransferase